MLFPQNILISITPIYHNWSSKLIYISQFIIVSSFFYIFCRVLCSLLSNEYINKGKKISLLCVFGAFCVISNTFWSNTTSIRTIWLNAREWELIAICKIWYEFLKICNSWNFLLLKFPKTLQISFRFGRAHSRGGKWWESFQILQSFQVDISIEIDKYDI